MQYYLYRVCVYADVSVSSIEVTKSEGEQRETFTTRVRGRWFDTLDPTYFSLYFSYSFLLSILSLVPFSSVRAMLLFVRILAQGYTIVLSHSPQLNRPQSSRPNVPLIIDECVSTSTVSADCVGSAVRDVGTAHGAVSSRR